MESSWCFLTLSDATTLLAAGGTAVFGPSSRTATRV